MKFQKLSEENSKLLDSLHEKDTEVAKLTESVEKLSAENDSVSSAKVVELSKKNRHLTAEIHALKSKLRNSEDCNRELEKLLEQKDEQLKETESNHESVSPAPSEVQAFSEKLEKATKKVFEVLNQNAHLKNELKILQKCLQQEVGENVTVAQLLSGKSIWRGRAQQISMLNSKIAELKEKLDATNMDSFDGISRLPLKRLESMRRLEVDSLSKELEDCKAQLEDSKQKVIATKTRNKNLTDEANNYKLKTLDLLEKSARDEEFIKCLNEQISMIKYECNHKLEEMKKEVERFESMRETVEVEIDKLQVQIQNQQEQLSEKESEISNLKMSMGELETNLRDISGDFLFSCRQMSKEDYVKLLTSLEQEKNELLGFVQQLNERLDKASFTTSEHHDTINRQRLKITRLEAKLREFDAEREAANVKNRRVIRVNEYSRTRSTSSINSSRSNDKLAAEANKYKFK